MDRGEWINTRLAESLENERLAAGAFFPLDQGIGTFSSHKNFPFKGLWCMSEMYVFEDGYL